MPYYFQREDADSPTNDFANIERNRELYGYLQRMSDTPIPGFGPAITTSAYSSLERDQILTQMFDYVRSTNLWDPNIGLRSRADGGGLNPSGVTFTDQYSVDPTVPSDDTSGEMTTPGLAQVTPIQIPTGFRPSPANFTMGFGRFPTLSEAGFVFMANAESPRTAVVVDNAADLPKDEEGNVNEEVKDEWERNKLRKASASSPFVMANGGPLAGHNASVATPSNPTAGQRMIQAWFPIELFYPMAGFAVTRPDIVIEVEFTDAVSVVSGGSSGTLWSSGTTATMKVNAPQANSRGGMVDVWGLQKAMVKSQGQNYANLLDKIVSAPVILPYNTDPTIKDANLDYDDFAKMELDAGKVTIRIYAGRDIDPSDANLVQTIILDFEQFAGLEMPQPYLAVDFANGPASGGFKDPNGKWVSLDKREEYLREYWWTFAEPHGRLAESRINLDRTGAEWKQATEANSVFHFAKKRPAVFGRDVVRTLQVRHGDLRIAAVQNYVDDTAATTDNQLYQPTQSYERGDPSDMRQGDGDGGDLTGSNVGPFAGFMVHNLTNIPGMYFKGVQIGADPDRGFATKGDNNSGHPAFMPYKAIPVDEKPARFGDFDLGTGNMQAGAYGNKPDEGTVKFQDGGSDKEQYPYLFYAGEQSAGSALFSPNRMIPSAAMFGSLPSKAAIDATTSGEPWRTLLFRPQPKNPSVASAAGGHPGSGVTSQSGTGGVKRPPYTVQPDFMFLDYFWMPIVEPYAISQPVATSGKVNMNYRIEPFSYIQRRTALEAALKSEFIAAVPTSRSAIVKDVGNRNDAFNYRRPLNLDETIRQFEERFDEGDLFRAEAEICSLHLVPDSEGGAGETVESMPDFYSVATNGFTGDENRERSYARLLPKLTTRSNTYTIHYRVQVLKQSTPGVGANTWHEATDQVLSEQRGSYTIERYIDPNDPKLLDPVFDSATQGNLEDASLEKFYKFRVVEHKKFTL